MAARTSGVLWELFEKRVKGSGWWLGDISSEIEGFSDVPGI
jgi:hypothetical protein